MTKPKNSPKQSATALKEVSKVRRKKIWQDLIFTSIAILLIIFGLWNNLANKYNVTNLCDKLGVQHMVTLQNDSFTPHYQVLKQCDILRVTNTGNTAYVLAFGVHERHIEYPGFSEQAIQPNQYIDITAIKTGSFTLHDHIEDKAILTLDITL